VGAADAAAGGSAAGRTLPRADRGGGRDGRAGRSDVTVRVGSAGSNAANSLQQGVGLRNQQQGCAAKARVLSINLLLWVPGAAALAFTPCITPTRILLVGSLQPRARRGCWRCTIPEEERCAQAGRAVVLHYAVRRPLARVRSVPCPSLKRTLSAQHDYYQPLAARGPARICARPRPPRRRCDALSCGHIAERTRRRPSRTSASSTGSSAGPRAGSRGTRWTPTPAVAMRACAPCRMSSPAS